MLARFVPIGLGALALGAALGLAGSAEANRSPICTRGYTTVEVDPHGLLPLTGANPIGPATEAALRFVPRSDRPQVTGARFAIADEQRGAIAKFSCGTRVWRRTIVVYVRARAFLPAQSASGPVFFVGRVASGYRVWQVVK